MPLEAFEGSVQLCPLCNKPFIQSSSYKRHLSYCRRAQNRSHARRKSCRACRIAKIKCDFQLKCSRCATKGIDCVYENRVGNAVTKGQIGALDESQSSTSFSALNESPASEVLNFETEIAWDLSNFSQSNQVFYNTSDDAAFEAANEVFGGQSSPLGNELTSSLPIYGSIPADSVTFRRLSCNHDGSFLTRLHKSEPLAQQSANLVIDALCAIPEQMLRRETLPPFIHPHWHHQDMPEPLAVCMRIAQMFASRTPDIAHFIWRTILTEQRRVIDCLPKMSKEEILAAMQAHMVYIIMRVIENTALTTDWNREMATSHLTVCNRFLDLCGGKFCEDEMTRPSLTWEDWIFAESSRRTSCVWFLITRTIAIKTLAGCPTSEQPWMLPLPSPKLQWEARNSATWQQEVNTGNPAIVTFGSLVESKRRCNEKSFAQRLDAWNARTDNLGSLLNIAVSMV